MSREFIRAQIPQIMLGELIALLERRDPTQNVSFDFASLSPTTLDSYRGYYPQLALGFADADSLSPRPTVASLLTHLRSAIGREFTGWKGGNYTMRESTALWVANPGTTGDTVIVGLHDCEYWTYIATDFHND